MSYYCKLFSQTFYGLLFWYLAITDVTSYVHRKFPVSFLLYFLPNHYCKQFYECSYHKKITLACFACLCFIIVDHLVFEVKFYLRDHIFLTSMFISPGKSPLFGLFLSETKRHKPGNTQFWRRNFLSVIIMTWIPGRRNAESVNHAQLEISALKNVETE